MRDPLVLRIHASVLASKSPEPTVSLTQPLQHTSTIVTPGESIRTKADATIRGATAELLICCIASSLGRSFKSVGKTTADLARVQVTEGA
jgi:hypothetical protein